MTSTLGMVPLGRAENRIVSTQLHAKLSPPSTLPLFGLFASDNIGNDRNLCGIDWVDKNKKGKRADFVQYWREEISVRDKLVRLVP